MSAPADNQVIRTSEVHPNDRIHALEQAVGWAIQVGDKQAKHCLQTMLREARESSRSGVTFA